MNNNQLNTIASILSSNGVNATKGSTLCAAILAGVHAGADIEVAFDHVIGKGAYQKFAADLYETLRSR
jgi:hypothetical protein